MSADVTFGIVGTGRMATQMMQSFAVLPDIRVQAVASRTSGRARQFADRFAIPKSYDDPAELFQDPGLDAVYIANAPGHHAADSIQALQAGKAVLCEKPFALTPEEGLAVLAAAEAAEKLFMEGLWTLALPAYRQLHTLVQSGDYGAPRLLSFEFGYPVRPDSHPGLFDPQSGGVLLDRGVYGLALALSLLGPAQSLTAGLCRDAQGTEVTAALQIAHTSGALSQIGVSLETLMQNAVSVACTGGMVGLAPPSIGAETVLSETTAPGELGAAVLDHPGLKTRLTARARQMPMLRRLKDRLGGGPSRSFHDYGAEPYQAMLVHFIGCLEGGHRTSSLIPPALSQQVIDLVAQAKITRDGQARPINVQPGDEAS